MFDTEALRRFGDGGAGDVSGACRWAADEIERLLRFAAEAERLLGFVEGINDERDAVPLLLEFRKLWRVAHPSHACQTQPDANDDGELAGISHIVSVLEHFDPPTRERMLTYLCGRFLCERAALSTAKRGE